MSNEYFRFNAETSDNMSNYGGRLVFTAKYKEKYAELIRFVDKDNNGITGNELKTFWNSILKASRSQCASVFDNQEAKNYIQQNLKNSKVQSADLISFVKLLKDYIIH